MFFLRYEDAAAIRTLKMEVEALQIEQKQQATSMILKDGTLILPKIKNYSMLHETAPLELPNLMFYDCRTRCRRN